MNAHSTAHAVEHRQPIGPIAELVAGIAADVLGAPGVDLGDDFLGSGGSSLHAARFAARLTTATGVPVRLNDVLSTTIIGDLVAMVEERYRDERGIHQDALRTVERDGPLPASVIQENQLLRDWRARSEGRLNPPRILPLIWRIDGRLDPTVVQATLDELVRRHEALRTAFDVSDGVVTQRILPPQPVALAGWSGSVEDLVSSQLPVPFALDGAPLLRGTLVEDGTGRQTLVLATDHTVFDGFCADLLFGDFAAVYRALATGADAPPAPAFQQVDCVAWQEQRLRGQTRERILGYWRDQLGPDGPFPQLDLPGAETEPRVAEWLSAELTPDERDALSDQARRHDTTLFTVVLGAVQYAVGTVLSRRDVVVHSPVTNRDHPDMEHVIGWFATSAVFRARLDGELTVQDHLDRVRTATFEAYAHQVPLPVLTRELQTGVFGGARAQRPARVFLGFDERAAQSVVEVPGAILTMEQTGAHGQPQPGLSFYVHVGDEGLSIALSAWRRDTSDTTYPALMASIRGFLDAFVADPKQRLTDLGPTCSS